jgi:putative transposase
MRYPSHYLKMKVLGAIDFAEGKSIRDRIKKVSQMRFEDEEGRLHRFTWRTIETWRTRFRKHGPEGMIARPRSDKGKTRKVNLEQIQEAIDQVLPEFRGKTHYKSHVYRACVEKGLLRREEIAPNTFSRIVNRHEMLKPRDRAESKLRLAFAKRHANEMWQADTMYGPHVKDPAGKPRQSYLVCFLDDASRVACHGEFFFNDNVEALLQTFRIAFYKRGLPEQIYVDNGAAYGSKEIVTVCARLGIVLSHAPVRDGAAKGKIEKFFRYVRSGFLSRNLDLTSLETLNRRFAVWVEEDYNCRPHATLGMKPIDRFGLDLDRIRRLAPNQANDELFFIEVERKVRKDNTFSLDNVRYEAPRDLRRRKAQVRYDRRKKDKIVVHYQGERIGLARPLDPVANDRAPRKRDKGGMTL